ncbi:hypothetical protein WJX73_009047 [Symbiochloris irregularis]|uniref:Metallo-beta-lactamase domain-containing protein n=1 Tax=Symbiochloris irregularis TaxID=706552 RepID=A0AAW1NV30_9CHLO
MGVKGVLSVVGVAVIGVLLGLNYSGKHSTPKTDQSVPAARFQEIKPGLYALPTLWKPLWGLATVPTNLFAVRVNKDWVLIDSGGEGAIEHVAEAVKQLLGSSDRLRAIFYTHAHFEHIGGTARLLQDHPDVLHILHEGEMPFLLTTKRHFWEPTDNWKWAISRYIAALMNNPLDTLPDISANTAVLHGKTGDLADITVQGKKVSWAPPRGRLQWLHVPGHSPGLMLLRHVPSNTIVAGDIFRIGLDKGTPKPELLPVINATQAVSSVKALADWGDWQVAYPCHDAGNGSSHAQFSDFANSL